MRLGRNPEAESQSVRTPTPSKWEGDGRGRGMNTRSETEARAREASDHRCKSPITPGDMGWVGSQLHYRLESGWAVERRGDSQTVIELPCPLLRAGSRYLLLTLTKRQVRIRAFSSGQGKHTLAGWTHKSAWR